MKDDDFMINFTIFMLAAAIGAGFAAYFVYFGPGRAVLWL